MKTTLFTYESPAGTFWIRPEPADRVQIATRKGLFLRVHSSPVYKVFVAVLWLLACSLAIAQPSAPDANRGFAGIHCAGEENAEILKAFGLKRGVVLIDVDKGSPAQRAGVQPEDVLLAVDGTPVNSVAEAARTSRIAVGSRVMFRIDRAGKSLDLSLTLVSFAEAFPDGGSVAVSATPKDISTKWEFGMQVSAFPAAERQARHFEGGDGIEVVAVDQGSFAEKIGVQPKDVIVSFNRRPVRSLDESS